MAAWSQWKWMLGVSFKMETAASVLLWKWLFGVSVTVETAVWGKQCHDKDAVPGKLIGKIQHMVIQWFRLWSFVQYMCIITMVIVGGGGVRGCHGDGNKWIQWLLWWSLNQYYHYGDGWCHDGFCLRASNCRWRFSCESRDISSPSVSRLSCKNNKYLIFKTFFILNIMQLQIKSLWILIFQKTYMAITCENTCETLTKREIGGILMSNR